MYQVAIPLGDNSAAFGFVMFMVNKKYRFYILNILIPLFLGLVIYCSIGSGILISRLICRVLPFACFKGGGGPVWLPSMVRNFFPDMLWAYSLTFAVAAIVLGEGKYVPLVAIICSVFEVAIEISQLSGLISGTFDLLDIILELSATMVALSIIELKLEGKV